MSNDAMLHPDRVQCVVCARTDRDDEHAGKQLEERFYPGLADREVALRQRRVRLK
jgi:hypothetical protein